MPGQRHRLAVLARLLVHPSILTIYAMWVVALLVFPPGQRFRMATILASAAFGAWQLAAGLVDFARRRMPLLNQGRVALGVGLLLSAVARHDGWFGAELLSNGIMLLGVLVLVRASVPEHAPPSD